MEASATASSVTEPAPPALGVLPPDYRLLRLITIDSYSPGGETIIDLSGGTLVLGDNGGGKTSLLRLIPLFYGENPSRINSGSKPFAEHYLARSTSFIIFEYLRRDIPCMSVLFVGERGYFRLMFIRSGYDFALFSTDPADGDVHRPIVPAHALRQHLGALKIIHTRALSVPEYGDVIQNRVAARREPALRAMAAEYAFTASGHHLNHIDKIVSGSFRRQADFNDFQRLVVDYLSTHERPITLSGDRAKIGAWPAEYAAYREVMLRSGQMTEALDREARLQACDQELRVIRAKLEAFTKELQARRVVLEADEKACKKALEDAQTIYLGAQGLAQADLSAATARCAAQRELIAALDRTADSYRRQDMPTKAAQVDRLEQTRAEHGQVVSRLEALLGEERLITSHYARLAQDVNAAFLMVREAAVTERTGLTQPYIERLASLDDQRRQEEESLRAHHQKELEPLILSKERITQKCGELAADIRNAPPDPEAVAALAAKRELLRKARADAKAATQALRVLQSALQKANQTRADTLAAKEQATRELVKKREAVEKLLAHATPEDGTLLQFLRLHRPTWSTDIGKVLNDDLLLRPDLAPDIAGASDSIYGLTLNLSGVDCSQFADEEQLQKAIAAARSVVANALKHETDLAEAARRAQQAFETAEQAQAKQAALALSNDERVNTLIAEETDAERAVEASIEQARATAKATLEVVLRTKEEVAVAIGKLDTKLKSVLAASATDYQGRQADAKATHDGALAQIAVRIATAEQHKMEQLQVLDAERSKALSEKNIDPLTVKDLEQRRDALSREITEALNRAPEVVVWRQWLANEWPRRDGLARELAVLEGEQKAVEQVLDDVAAEWGQATRLHTETKDKLDRQRFALARQELRVASLMERLDGVTADPATAALPYEPIWTDETLAVRMNEQFAVQRALLADLKVRVHEIKAAFRSGNVANSPTEQFFESIRGKLGVTQEENPRAWVMPLKEWYDGRHKEHLSALMTQGRAMGSLVLRFHQELTEFARGIHNLNRDLTASLNETMVFAHISRIRIELQSTIDKLQYWPLIRDFVETHRDWITGIDASEPPETFSDGMRGLMSHWEISEGIQADPRSLIEIRGEAVENNKAKQFATGKDLANLSSNGLSYLILCTIYVAFLRMIRDKARVHITWAVDELLDLDPRNIAALVGMLKQNDISLVTACPSSDTDIMRLFPNRYRVMQGDAGPVIINTRLQA